MTTIQNFVVAATLDPGGIRQGLDDALGYVGRFSRTADQLFANIASEKDGIAAAQRIVTGLKSELTRAQGEIKEDLFRGFVDLPTAQRQGEQVGKAFDTGVLRALDQLRGRANTDRVFAAGLPKIEQTLVAALGTAGNRAGAAFNRSLGVELGKGPPGGGGADSPIGSAINALNRQSHIGAAGVGIIRRELIGLTASITNTLPLLDRLGASLLQFSGIGGATTFGVIAGITAIAGAYHLITAGAREAAEENKKALDSIKNEVDALHRHISERAVSAAEEQVRTAQEAVDRINQQRAARTSLGSAGQTLLPQISAIDSQKEAAALREANITLQAAIQNRDKLRREAKKAGDDSYDGQLASLIKFNHATAAERTIALDRLRAYEKEAAALTKSGADNERRVFVLNQAKDLRDALFPKAKAAGEPFPELKGQIADLVAAFNDLRAEGIAPTIALQTRAEQEFERLGRRIAMLPDQTGRAARSLAEMRKQLEPIVHMNEGALLRSPTPGEDQLHIPGTGPTRDQATLTKQVNEQIQRVQALREAFGELDARTLTAQGDLARTFANLKNATDAETDATRIGTDALRAMAAARRELDAGQKASFGEMFTPEMAAQLKQTIAEVDTWLKNLNASGKDTREVFDSIRTGIMGMIDAATGLGLISDDIRKVATSATHLVSALKQVRDVRKARETAQAREAESPGTGGAMAGILGTVSNIAAIGGAIGAGISVISGIVGLFSSHDETIKENSKALDNLRESLVDTMGVQGQQNARQAIENLRQLYARPGFTMQSSATKDQQIADAVAEAGISIEQFNKIMHDFNIVPEKTGKWLDTFRDALGLATAAATKWGTTLDDQLSLASLHNKVFGNTDPNTSIQSTIAVLGKLAPSIGTMLQGFDTATQEGREGLRTALQNLVTMIENGAITPEMLGKLTGVKDLGSVIGTITDSLEEMGKSVDDVTKAMSVNIPSWYKLGALRAVAADPMDRPTTGTSTSGPFTPSTRPPDTGGTPLTGGLQLDLIPAVQDSSTALSGLATQADALSAVLAQLAGTRETSGIAPSSQTDALAAVLAQIQGIVAATQLPQATDLKPYVPAQIDTRPLSGSGSEGSSFVWYGDAYIDARSKTDAELFDAMLREGQRRAATRFRSTKDWAKVQS